MKEEILIIDTDILIWFFRNNTKAVEIVRTSLPFSVSVITSMEIMQGMKNKRELERMKTMFSFLGVNILQINESISQLAEKFVEKYALSHAMKLPDALIAATCVIHHQPLLTGNLKPSQEWNGWSSLTTHFLWK